MMRTVAVSQYEEINKYLASQLKETKGDVAVRCGTLTVFDMGTLKKNSLYYHTKEVIFPLHFKSVRLFWSRLYPMKRTSYMFDILSDVDVERLGIDPTTLGEPINSNNLSYAQFAQTTARNSSSATASATASATYLSEQTSTLQQLTLEQLTYSIRSLDPTLSSVVKDETDVECSTLEKPIFRLLIGDEPDVIILSRSVYDLYYALIKSVDDHRSRQLMALSQQLVAITTPASMAASVDAGAKASSSAATHTSNSITSSCVGDLFPACLLSRPSRNAYGLNPAYFFGFGMPFVRYAMEQNPECCLMMAALPPTPSYVPYY